LVNFYMVYKDVFVFVLWWDLSGFFL
jgi:hypothetical protein